MKKNRVPLGMILLVMVGLPWAAVTFAPGDAGMAVCFVLFFGVNPMCSLYVGIYAGLDGKGRWYLPLVSAGVFLLGTWLIFAAEEPAFTGYAIAYLVVSLLAMVVTVVVRRNIRKELGTSYSN